MLLDLDYGIDDSHCSDICLLSHKIILYIPTHLINVGPDDTIHLDYTLKRFLEYIKRNNKNGARIYALLPSNISNKYFDLLSEYLVNNYNVTIIKSIKSALVFDKSKLPFEKLLNVLEKQKKMTFNNVIDRDKFLMSFNPLVFVNSDVYNRILKCHDERNFRSTSKIPQLQSTFAQVLGSMFRNDAIKVFTDDSYEYFRSFAISDINSTLELQAINHLYSLVLGEIKKSPKKLTVDIIDKCLEEAYQFYLKTANEILGEVTEKGEKRVKTILEKSAQLLISIPPNQLLRKELESNKLNKGLHMGLGLTAMIRRPGRGNLQWYTNYQVGPLTLTLGFANDKDLCSNNIPPFRLQPKIHINLNL